VNSKREDDFCKDTNGIFPGEEFPGLSARS